MRLPEPAPDLRQILERLDPERIQVVFQNTTPLPKGRYLHWDEMRYRDPPPGLSRDEWWATVTISRAALMQNLPLLDKQGLPFRFATPSPVLIDLHHIDRDAAGQIRSTAGEPLREDPNRYLMSSLIEEAITSSQLEGASTTRQIAAAMLRTGRKPADHSERMIFNNYRAMEHLRTLKHEALTPEHILELHRILTTDTLENPEEAGRLRQSDDVHVVDQRDDAIVHVPPDHQELPERLERLCAFANADETSLPFVHPVLRAILLHFMIGYDHPFVDGNGRTARALFYWSMARSGYWLMEYTSISHILRRAPSRYMRAYLHTETDGNDTTYFLLHQLTTIRRAIVALHEYLGRKTQEQKETERMLAASPALRTRFNHRQVALLTHALRNTGEGYRVDAHQRSHNVVYQTARSDLLTLHELGLLEKAKQGNAYVFFAPPDLKDRLAAMAK
ncbi:filamentation induced by cAMP protein fic [Denitratisoma sp. DHT3]|uniref:Fic family protein n=1 Tax=Denitratisoma sp. DHT3 TaxID=1981880 RepID=UPI001198A5E9|nr:Fic family protein [Denitratisoma sp. DHT3]QDX82063.1 filamentation induced by cAMP protein fic [Denitratisoma sp. DHT3]